MGKHSPTSLLAVSDFFETKALFALAAYEAEEKFRENPSYWLMIEIVRLTQCPKPTPEQWDSWMATNQTTIGGIAARNWAMLPGAKAIAVGEYGPKASFITKEPQLPFEQLDVSSQAILRASPPIPQLWLWTGTVIKGKIYEPAVAQDAWLFEAMKRMFETYGDEENKAQDIKITDFIKKNRPAIDKIRSAFFQQPKNLGAGADGVAYDIGQGRVLKIFGDQSSFTKAVEAINRLHKQPQVAKTEAMIYDAGLLGRFQRYEDQSVDVYYYIMEKMTPLKDYFGADIEIRKILIHIADYIRNNKNDFFDLKSQMENPEEHSSVKGEVARMAENMAASLMARSETLLDKIEDKIPGLRRSWLVSYIEEVMMKYLTGRGDLHMGNLGVTNYGDLRYFDPAHVDWTTTINAPRKGDEEDSYPQRKTAPTSRNQSEE